MRVNGEEEAFVESAGLLAGRTQLEKIVPTP
jgi:hypothetical protein